MLPERSYRILVADDNSESLFVLQTLLEKQGFEVVTATNGQEALEIVEKSDIDVALLDVVMPKMSGLDVVSRLKDNSAYRYIPLVLVTSRDGLDDIADAFERGADDYIIKPFDSKELLARIQAALRTRALYLELLSTTEEKHRLSEQIKEVFSFSNIIGKSKKMQELFSLIQRIAPSSVPVLIFGESGTGKELVAKALHFNSPRKDKPLVIQNCSAFSETLLESELFGHVKGSFTGAVKDKPGLFTIADGGTLFLDELGEMSLALQAKLLRVLQDGTFTPVGETRPRKVDVRVVAATHRDIPKMIQEGKFREDLYYRLNVISLNIPPLRERKDDIPLLIEAFLSKSDDGKQKVLAPETLKSFLDYSWPGNVRQLENEIARLVVLSGDAEELGKEFLSSALTNQLANQSEQRRAASSNQSVDGTLPEAIENLEKTMIRDVLSKVDGNKSEAARVLGISRSSLIAKVQEYGLE